MEYDWGPYKTKLVSRIIFGTILMFGTFALGLLLVYIVQFETWMYSRAGMQGVLALPAFGSALFAFILTRKSVKNKGGDTPMLILAFTSAWLVLSLVR